MNEIQNTEIKQIELEINFYKSQAVQSIFEIGERLIKAKELVEHGEWENWLREKVDFSTSQARRFMQVSREFSNRVSLHGLGQTKVFALLSVPEEERETFLEENPVEDMTTRELRQAIKENKELKNQVNELKNKKPEVVEKEVKVEVIPSDYNKIKRQLRDKEDKLESLEKEKQILEREKQMNEKNSKRYKELKGQIESLSKQKNDLGRKIKSTTELSGLVVEVKHFFDKKFAPIKYSGAVREACKDEIVQRNLKEIIETFQEWIDEMNKHIDDTNLYDAEVIE